MKVTLKILEHPGAHPKTLEIKQSCLIGRNVDCDIRLEQPKVSRQHARIVIDEEAVQLSDLNSANGILIGNKKLSDGLSILLCDGMIFRIGTATFEVEIEEGESEKNFLWYRVEDGGWQRLYFSDKVLIGRSDQCDLLLDEEHVSREHSKIVQRNGQFFIEDLDSHNGTYIEEKRIPVGEPKLFKAGQYIRIGHTTVTLAEAKQQREYESQMTQFRTRERQIKHTAKPGGDSIKRTKMWPFVVGIAGIMMACICFLVVGGIFLLDRSMASPTMVVVNENEGQFQLQTPTTETSGSDGFTATPTELTPVVEEDKVDWLVLLYQNADDENLEEDIVFDVNSAEFVGSDENVKIVTQLDRYEGSYAGDGDWSQSRRYILENGEDLEQIESDIEQDLGEIDSGNVQTLIDFVLWGLNEYPANHVILIMSDHGAGWFGGYLDGDNGNIDGIYLPALDSALAYILAQSELQKFDIIGFDACLMAQLEVYSMLSPYADIAVASEETESATGWAYAAFLKTLTQNPSMSPKELSKQIVDTFVEGDIYYEYYEYDPGFTMDTSTLSALDLSKVSELNRVFNEFVSVLEPVDSSIVAEARNYTRSYLLYEDYVPSFLDLVNFVNMVCTYSGDQDVCLQAENVSRVMTEAIIAEKHGEDMQGSYGLSFYFPDADFFEITMDDTYGYAYRQHAERFTEISKWDEFLDYHYLGRSMP